MGCVSRVVKMHYWQPYRLKIYWPPFGLPTQKSWRRHCHTPKSCCPLYAVHSLSRGNLKNLMLRSFTFVCQLYCCSSKHNNNKALRITFNSCKTVSTSSMALPMVNIDKIIDDVSVILCIGNHVRAC